MAEKNTETLHRGKMPSEKRTRASPQTNDDKAQEMLEKAKSEPKPDWDVAEQVVLIPLDQLKPFKNHPYRVDDNDELMQDTIDSILAGGVINPILVRPSDDGKFEIVSGHRRVRASAFACKPTIKAIVREMDDDTAVITILLLIRIACVQSFLAVLTFFSSLWFCVTGNRSIFLPFRCRMTGLHFRSRCQARKIFADCR